MKLIEGTPERRVFGLTQREKTLLERLLSFYPLGVDGVARLTREPVASLEEADAMLQEALRERKAELAGWLALQFSEGEAFQRVGSGWHMTVSEEETERLLQVLNELRVGAWTKLGCPEEIDAEGLLRKAGGVPYFDIMVLSGHFQTHLLSGLHGDGAEAESGGESGGP